MARDQRVEVCWQGEGESKGHESGRKIIGILDKKKSDYDDIDHMKKVVGYVNRHQAQKPEGDLEGSNWRYSLLNWSHDPLNYFPRTSTAVPKTHASSSLKEE